MAVFHYAGAPNANPTTDPSVNIPVIELPLSETDLHVSRMFYINIFTNEIIFFNLSLCPATCSRPRGKFLLDDILLL